MRQIVSQHIFGIRAVHPPLAVFILAALTEQALPIATRPGIEGRAVHEHVPWVAVGHPVLCRETAESTEKIRVIDMISMPDCEQSRQKLRVVRTTFRQHKL